MGKKQNRSVVITTIHKENKVLKSFARRKDYRVVIVGDKKSPKHYAVDAVFLSVDAQKKRFKRFSDLLPYNHYSRKNIGYLYALEQGDEYITESDDDNMPLPGWGVIPHQASYEVITAPQFPNVYRLFSRQTIWPRGFPLDLISKPQKITIKKKLPSNVLVWQGLADGEPDVDAIYRLVINKPVAFRKRRPVVLDKGIISPFNSQNTLWHRDALYLAYLPHSVSFRYTDILRSFVAQYGIWARGGRVGFHSSTVKQIRNKHDLLRDFKDECEMYNTFYVAISALRGCKLVGTPKDLLTMYRALSNVGVVKRKELPTVKEWIRLCQTVRK